MIITRLSDAESFNKKINKVERRRKENNHELVNRVSDSTDLKGHVVLLGGCDNTNFRIRIAQADVRRDLLPSFWSHAAIIVGKNKDDWRLNEVSLSPVNGFDDVPYSNGVQESMLSDYKDQKVYPNIAIIDFKLKYNHIRNAIDDFYRERSFIDSASLIIEWLGYIWGAGDKGNPLLNGTGLPSSSFVEGVFSLANKDLGPGSSTRVSCPEVIWQSAKWWHEFYKLADNDESIPSGFYCIDQEAACVVE